MDQLTEIDNEIEVVETRVVKRITIGRIFSSIFEAFNIERGGIFTLKALFTNPGLTVKDYLGENRYRYTPPFRILIVTTALALYFISLSNFDVGADFAEGFNASTDSAENEAEAKRIIESITNVFLNYANFILWTFIPIVALFSYLFNRKQGYNYAEHLVYQTYLFCISNMLTVFIPLGNYLSAGLSMLLIYAGLSFYIVYSYKVFVNHSIAKSIWHSFIIYSIATFLWIVFLMIGLILVALFNK